jgi:toxin HigB-1
LPFCGNAPRPGCLEGVVNKRRDAPTARANEVGARSDGHQARGELRDAGCSEMVGCHTTGYIERMPIKSFRHNGLREFFEAGRSRGVRADQTKRLRRLLTALETAAGIDDMNLFPGWRLHPLTGDRKGFWSVSVTGNWRLIFRFEDGEARDLDRPGGYH